MVPVQGREWRCEGCGATLEPAAQFCGECGRPAPGGEEPLPEETGYPSAPAGAEWGLERFHFTGQLGRGASGTVHLAFDAVLGREVAVKLLEIPPDRPELLASYRREIEVLSRADHPNLAAVLAHGSEGNVHWMAVEYEPGCTLRQLLDHAGRLDVAQTAAVLDGALEGLGHLHSLGLVHGDVTPANVIVTRDGVSKLIDFGSSWVSGGPAAPATPTYASPEALAGEPVDARSDLYSAGAVLFECAAGRPVREGGALPSLGPAPDPAEMRREVPGPLRDLVGDALAGAPEDRPQTAAEFLERLRAAAESSGAGAAWRDRAALAALAGVLGAEVAALSAGTGSPTPAPGADPPSSHPGPPHGWNPHRGTVTARSRPTLRRVAQGLAAHRVATAAVAGVLAASGVGAGLALGGGAGPSGGSATPPAAEGSPVPGVTGTGSTAPTRPQMEPPPSGVGGQGSPRSRTARRPSGSGASGIPDPAGGFWTTPQSIFSLGGSAVSCGSATFCMAVGDQADSDGSHAYAVYDGRHWETVGLLPPSIDPWNPIEVNDLSCAAPRFCMLIGGTGVWTYDGTSWRSAASPIAEDAGILTADSCTSSSFCMATENVDAGPSENLAASYVFDGTSWSLPASIPLGVDALMVRAVSCASPSWCTAVDDGGDSYTYSAGTWAPPATVFANWSGIPPYLDSVACPSSTWCVAMGGPWYDQTTAIVDVGGVWGKPSETARGATGTDSQVSCPVEGWCKAVAPTVGVVTYHDGTWSEPDRMGMDDGTYLSFPVRTLESISCPTTAFCVALNSAGEVSQFSDDLVSRSS